MSFIYVSYLLSVPPVPTTNQKWGGGARAPLCPMVSAPMTTHVLQPLDRVFYGPLKTFYNKACESFMLHNPSKRITDYDIAGLFNTAYMAAATIDKGVSGFECTGIFPLNRHRIPEFCFTPSLTTDNASDQRFSNFLDHGPLFSSGIVGALADPHTCYSKIYCKILKFLSTLLFTNKPTSSIIYKLQCIEWKANSVSVMDVLASLCTDCQFLA